MGHEMWENEMWGGEVHAPGVRDLAGVGALAAAADQRGAAVAGLGRREPLVVLADAAGAGGRVRPGVRRRAALGRPVPHRAKRVVVGGTRSTAIVARRALRIAVEERDQQAVGGAVRRPRRVDRHGVPAVVHVGHRPPRPARLPARPERQPRLEPADLDRLALIVDQLQLEDAGRRGAAEPAAGRRGDPGAEQVDAEPEEGDVQRRQPRQPAGGRAELGRGRAQRVAPEVEVAEPRRQAARQAGQRVVRQVERRELGAGRQAGAAVPGEGAAVDVDGRRAEAGRQGAGEPGEVEAQRREDSEAAERLRNRSGQTCSIWSEQESFYFRIIYFKMSFLK